MHPVPNYLPGNVCMLTHLHMHEHQHQHQYAALTCTHIHPAEMTQHVNCCTTFFGKSLCFSSSIVQAQSCRPATSLQQRQCTSQHSGRPCKLTQTGCDHDNDDDMAAARCFQSDAAALLDRVWQIWCDDQGVMTMV